MNNLHGSTIDNSEIEKFGKEASILVNEWNRNNTKRCCVTLKTKITEVDKKTQLRTVALLMSTGELCSVRQDSFPSFYFLVIEFDRDTQKFMAHNPALTIFDKKEFTLQDFKPILDSFSKHIIFS